MNTLICAGGTGIRVLEAVLQLCAAGLGPDNLRVLVIDPDRANGNGDRTSTLVDRYREGTRLFGRKLGEGLRLFGTELDLLEVGSESGLKIWSPVSTTDRLQELLKISLLGSTGMPADLWQLFFTRQELDMDLSEGFRARPSVGAAAMSMVALQADEPPWKLLLQRLENDLAQETGAQVFLTGSVFGGTGAATLFPIGRFLRDRLTGQRLRIAAAPLTPYFRFAAAAADPSQAAVAEAARSEDFPTHTRGAVDFYRHLERHDAPPFDVLFWIGDSTPRTVDYAPGGTRQRNPAHVVELVTALAALEFFGAPTAVRGSCYAAAELAAGPDRQPGDTPIRWEDLPLIRRGHGQLRHALTRFWLTGLVHLGFTGPLVRRPEIDRDPRLVPWYWQRFARRGDALSTDENREALDFLDEFFAGHHFPWWQQLHLEPTVRLANPAALPNGDGLSLDRLANVLWPDRPGEADPEAIDRFYTDLSTVPRRLGGTGGASAYFALLAHAAERFITREYQNLSPLED
jgi:hypothetical protein